MKHKKSPAGFTAVEFLLVLVVVLFIGLAGWYIYRHQNVPRTTAAAAQVPINYSGWKTYHSILASGLSFKYLSNWIFNPAGSTDGNENLSELYSAKPTTKLGPSAAVATNVFMCVSFDEYKYSQAGYTYYPYSEYMGWPILSQTAKVNGSNLTLVIYKGPKPMQDAMVLYNPQDTTPHGGQIITTNHGYAVTVTAQFNCHQAGFPQGTNLNTNFAQ